MPRPNFDEIAQITRDLNYAYLKGYKRLISRDELLNLKGGGDLKLYETVAQDDQVKSCVQQRISAVISRDWGVEPGDDSKPAKQAAEFIEQELKNLQWDRINEKMLWGTFYGYSVGEIMWRRGDKIGIADIKVRNRRRFNFGTDLQPKLITLEDPMGEDLPDQKFWHFCCGGDNDDDPYGHGLAHWLYWPTFFKRSDMRWWVTFLEKYAQPSRLGKYSPGASEGDKETLWQAMDAFGTNGKMLIPEGTAIELLEASRAGGADYQEMLDICNAAISKIVLSQTMTTDDGSSQSQANVHQDVKDDIVKADSDLVCSSFNNGPIKWLVDWNFPGVAYPRVWRQMESAPDLTAEAERDIKLQGLGISLKPESIAAKYGDDYFVPERESPQLAGEQVTALISIVTSATQGGWNPELVRGLIVSSFPGLSDDAIGSIVDNLGGESTGTMTEVDLDSVSAQFAAKKATGAVQSKKCAKGLSCGGACISTTKICKRILSIDQQKELKALKKRLKSGDLEAEAGIQAIKDKQQQQPKPFHPLMKIVNKLRSINFGDPSALVGNNDIEGRNIMYELKEALYENGMTEDNARSLARSIEMPQISTNFTAQDKKDLEDDATEFFQLTNGVGKKPIETFTRARERACQNSVTKTIDIGVQSSVKTVFHEMGHAFESDLGWGQNGIDWVKSRATGEKESLNKLTNTNAYGDTETAYPDRFADEYVGKVYNDGTDFAASEVLSMGLEAFVTSHSMLNLWKADKKHFEYTINALIQARKNV